MNNKNFVIFFMLIAVALIWLVNRADDQMVEDAQSGVITLKCHMKDGMRAIKPNQIEGLMDGVWIFKNGSARNCEVIDNG